MAQQMNIDDNIRYQHIISAVSTEQNGKASCTKHIETRYFYISDKKVNGIMYWY